MSVETVDWFDRFDGAKSTGWEAGQFVCVLGWNETDGDVVRGCQVEARAATLEAAMAEARAKYEQSR